MWSPHNTDHLICNSVNQDCNSEEWTAIERLQNSKCNAIQIPTLQAKKVHCFDRYAFGCMDQGPREGESTIRRVDGEHQDLTPETKRKKSGSQTDILRLPETDSSTNSTGALFKKNISPFRSRSGGHC
ncbi:ZNF423 [Lepeophtheirus salmonis]|uniref:ZNF423 n=1 Tax=Lepeophtheirus salmonis TaxID=72036 RepID=A0A7R8DBW9_LEPSM|nr:ZNF423 [Lepeophtheirus salmonis]CAF3038053.1 ZNF423 [Lepeophtheirus salmonis]